MRFGLLGTVTVTDDEGAARPVGSAKLRALLAALLATPGRAVPLDALRAALWGDAPPATATASLHNHVARLRRLLAEGGGSGAEGAGADRAGSRLRAVAPGYLLDVAGDEVDAEVFLRHHAAARAAHRAHDWPSVLGGSADALALWRGDPLSDVPVRYDPMRAYAAHLAEARLQVLEWRFDAELSLGHHQGLTAELGVLTAEHPLRESFHRQWMLALHRTHRQAEALAAFHRLRRTLVDELGVEPGPAVQQAYQEILAPPPPTPAPAPEGLLPNTPLTAPSWAPTTEETAGEPDTEDAALGEPEPAEGAAAPHPTPDPPARRTPPAQLPADIGDFTGRAAELAALLQAMRAPSDVRALAVPGTPAAPSSSATLAGPGTPGIAGTADGTVPAALGGPTAEGSGPAPGGAAGDSGPWPAAAPRVAVVSGMGGIGKTALAVHAAHLLRAEFPDGLLYADLRGFGAGGARQPNDLLARFLADLGEDGQPLPDHPDDRAALLRHALHERRVLLVLDNAGEAAQVIPLLPGGGGSAVIVTSRRTLADLPGAVRLPLHPLTADEQHELLTAVCGEQRVSAEPDAAAGVLAACGGLPLALRIAGARLATRPNWPLTALAERLDHAGRRLSALSAGGLAVQDTFAMSYVAMRDSPLQGERETARAFRMLGLWPGHPLAPASAAALLSREPLAAEDVLEALVDAHLLQSPRHGSYTFHDLLGEYAAGRAAEEVSPRDSDEALRRLVAWYAAAVNASAVVLAPEGHPIPPLDDELLSPAPRFGSDEDALRWCVRELPAIKEAIRQAAAHGWSDAAWRLAAGLFGYAQAYWWTGEWTACLEEAMACVRETGDVVGQAWMHSRLGVAHGMAGRLDSCLDHLTFAERYFEAAGDIRGHAAILNNLAGLHRIMGRYDRALEYGQRSLALDLSVGDDDRVATVLGTLGDIHLGAGDPEAAAGRYREALAMWRERGVLSSIARALTSLGEALHALGRYDEAVAALEETLGLLGRLGDRGTVADVLEILGRTHFELGDHAAARKCWDEGLEIARAHHLTSETEALQRNLARLAPAGGPPPLA